MIEDRSKFEEQYASDCLAERTVVQNVLYYDEEEEQYVRADIELFGNSYLLKTYTKKGGLWKSVRSTSVGEKGASCRLMQELDGMLVIELGNSLVMTDYDSTGKILSHFEELNVGHLEISNQQARELSEKVRSVLADGELVFMLREFINRTAIDLFIQPRLIHQVEAYLEYVHGACRGWKNLLWTDDVRRVLNAKIKYVKKHDRIYEELVLDEQDLIITYFETGLDLLSRLIAERWNYDLHMSTYLAYLCLRSQSCIVLAEQWRTNYGLCFELSQKGLEDALMSYLSIQTVNHEHYHVAGTFIYYLMTKNVFRANDNYLLCYDEFLKMYKQSVQQQQLAVFKRSLIKSSENEIARSVSIDDVDMMNGAEFEQLISSLFVKMGYKAALIGRTGDQGVDVVVEKDGVRIGIQAKCYSGPVGNSAIQEVVAGRSYHRLDKAMVITNSRFTNSAIELAISNHVVLWDRSLLKEKLLQF